MGYVDDLEKTKDSLDEDGWLRTGDKGKLDPVHGLIITGRFKVSTCTFELPPSPRELCGSIWNGSPISYHSVPSY